MKSKLSTDSIGKLLVEFSIPAIIGSLIVMLYTVVDRIFIGQKLGAEALAGVTLTFPFSQISVALGTLVGTGGSILVAIELGKKKIEKSSKIVGNQFILFLIFCSIMTVMQEIFLVDILKSMGGYGRTLEYAVSYGRIFIPVIFFQCYSYGLNGAIRAQGFPKFTMISLSIGAILNIILDYIFMWPLNMGVFGAGLATFISSAIPAILNIRFLTSNRGEIILKKRHLKLEKKIVKSILQLGASAGLITFSNAIVMAMYNLQLNTYVGSKGVAAYGVFMTIHSMIIMLIMGMVQGGTLPILGYNLGAGNYKRVVDTIKLTFKSGVILSLVAMLGVQMFPREILRIFVKDIETIDIGINALRLGFSVVPIMVITIIISGIYQGLGEAKLAFIFNFVRKIAIIVPVVYIIPKIIGVEGIWLSRPISDTVAFFLMIYTFKGTMDRLSKRQDAN